MGSCLIALKRRQPARTRHKLLTPGQVKPAAESHLRISAHNEPGMPDMSTTAANSVADPNW